MKTQDEKWTEHLRRKVARLEQFRKRETTIAAERRRIERELDSARRELARREQAEREPPHEEAEREPPHEEAEREPHEDPA